MVVRVLLLVLGLFHIANGLYMLTAPAEWYAAVPGVTLTGPFNHHFVQDIGMAFLASGAGLAWGMRRGRSAAIFACAGAVWPALHALIHVDGWLVHGIAPGTAAAELVGVGALALLGVVLAWARLRGEGA
ncbi:MAG: hypothetical protein JOZ72_14065 [Alphaproteobacteria bacterium]|nr:hypothetical protein [Alphaproteobacteria bacterium]